MGDAPARAKEPNAPVAAGAQKTVAPPVVTTDVPAMLDLGVTQLPGGAWTETWMLGLQRGAGNSAVASMLQRASVSMAPPAPALDALTAAQVTAAKAKAAHLRPQWIRQLQNRLSWLETTLGVHKNDPARVIETGIYDDETAQGVYLQQRQWQKTGPIADPGFATDDVFTRLGIILTKEFESAPLAAGTDVVKLAHMIASQFPNGVTVAAYSLYANIATPGANEAEFLRQANTFAKGQQAVGLQAGTITLNVPVGITSVGDLIEKVQSIHLGLVDLWQPSTLPAGTPGAEAAAVGAAIGAVGQVVSGMTGVLPTVPTWTKVATLATFAHGIHQGVNLGTTPEAKYASEGLHINTTQDGKEYQSNVESFAKGLRGAVTPDIKVLIFACSTAGSPKPGTGFEHYAELSGPQAVVEHARETAYDKAIADASKAASDKVIQDASDAAKAQAVTEGKSAAEATQAANAAAISPATKAAAKQAGKDAAKNPTNLAAAKKAGDKAATDALPGAPAKAEAAAERDLPKQEATGPGSLAEALEKSLESELQGDPSVYGHLTAAHATRNPAAKVFGKDAGGQPGGRHMFDLIYDDPYIDGRLAALFPATPADKKVGLRAQLLMRMFEHYFDQIQFDPDHPKGHPNQPAAQEMFADFRKAQSWLQPDMTDWLSSHVDDLRPLPPPAPSEFPGRGAQRPASAPPGPPSP